MYDVTTWEKNNCNHVLDNILRSKSNQIMKFRRFIEYNMRNIFLENHTLNVGEKLFRNPF